MPCLHTEWSEYKIPVLQKKSKKFVCQNYFFGSDSVETILGMSKQFSFDKVEEF